MYKDYRFINAGENEVYRYGRKARKKVASFIEPNENGFYNIPADGGRYWTIGTSNGKYGEFAKINNTIFSVNKAGYVWAKEGTEKAEKFVEGLTQMIEFMNDLYNESIAEQIEDEDE